MDKTYLQLGRTGDIITLLPLLWQDAQVGQKPSLMVASEFAQILDGVSYVEPLIFKGPYYAIGEAAEQLEVAGRKYVCTQVNGPIDLVREHTYQPAGQDVAKTTSFQKEMWKVAGRLKDWDKTFPLVFDRRDPKREAALVKRVLKRRKGMKKPYILLALDGSTSPFPQKNTLRELLKATFKDQYQIVDLSTVIADRFFDLLALYEGAACLVAADSAPLHLARACPYLPVVALVNDKPQPWNGSSWQPNHVFYCRYSDFDARVDELVSYVESPPTLDPPDQPVFVNVWNSYDGHPSEYFQRRHELPAHWSLLPVRPGQCGRDTKMILKDEKRIPYLKDCLRMALQRARDCDFVVLTRPDTRLTSEDVEKDLLAQDACYCYRFNRNAAGQDTHAPIVDFFCARKPWWTAHLENIPDFNLGTDYYWSHGLFGLFMKNGARLLYGAVYRPEK